MTEYNYYAPRKQVPMRSKRQQSYQQPLDPTVEKLRRWLLIGLSSLVGGIAIIMIVASLIRKFF